MKKMPEIDFLNGIVEEKLHAYLKMRIRHYAEKYAAAMIHTDSAHADLVRKNKELQLELEHERSKNKNFSRH